MTIKEAADIMGKNFIGPDEVSALPRPFSFGNIIAPEISFLADVLHLRGETHILISTESGT